MCNDREKLIAYLYDEASTSERREVDAHLVGCAECRDELRAFRGVRQDLLAWDVPAHESVWKPFVTPVVVPWWKQVPAWGLAAAATLVFGIGLAGGFAARALSAPPVLASAQAAPTAGAVAPSTVATTEQVRSLEDRLASIERVAVTRPDAGGGNVTLTRAELQQLLKDTESRANQYTTLKLLRSIAELNKQRQWDQQATTQQINEMQQQVNANLYRVATRGTLEKEKEQ